MKRFPVAGLLIALCCLVLPAMGATYPLYAGQDIQVGYIDVSNTGSTMFVDFILDPGWYITAGHVHVGDALSDIPRTKNGNPIPGLFEYFAVFDPPVHNPDPFVVDITGLTPPLIVATHAVVEKITTGQTMYLSSGTNTDVIKVNGVLQPVGTKAVAANEPFNYPTCSYYTPSDTFKSLWDNRIGTIYFGIFNPTADWIWNNPNPDRVIQGDVVKFQEKFTIPGYPISGSKLYITVDNAYIAVLNGVFVGQAQLGPGFPTGELREEVVANNPRTGLWGVASQGWETVETYDLAPVKGENTLDITAANEYMNDKMNPVDPNYFLGPDYYMNANWPASGPRIIDPFPNGIGGSAEGPQSCYNPGALIYKARINYDRIDQRETAWGAGTAFGGKNWATYFTYTPTV